MVDYISFTILLVDDNVLNMDMLVQTLGSEFEVMVAMDGASALEIIPQERPHLILLDIEMPEMDGYEVLHRLKADPATASIPVVFLSGRTGKAEVAKGLAAGAAGYLTKPFQASEILETVRRILDETYGTGRDTSA